MSSSRSSTLAVITLTLCALLTSCTRSTGPLCVDHLCFDLPLNTPVRSREQKHSILPENAAGWIDVQKYTPPAQPTATLATLSDLFAQRHALSSAVHVISHQTTTLPRMNRDVPVVDLTLEWHGASYRRRSCCSRETRITRGP